MNIGGLNYSASVNTRFYQQTWQAANGTAPTSLSSTFALDINNPFYRIMAGTVGDTTNAWASQFTFSNGGTTVGSPFTVIWGNDTVYNASTSGQVSGFQITPYLGTDTLFTHSQYADACGAIVPQLGINQGFISRWTALADKVIIYSYPLTPVQNVSAASEYFHGIIQQPW